MHYHDHHDRRLFSDGSTKDDDGIEAAIVTGVLFFTLFLFLFILLLARYVSYVCCPSSQTSNEVTTDAMNDQDLIPYLSKMRRVYLEEMITSKEFHGGDIETGITTTTTTTSALQCNDMMTSYESISNDVTPVTTPINEYCDTKTSNMNNSVHSSSNKSITSTIPQCMICYESLHNGDDVTSHCNTIYHRSCIIEWLLRNDNCPYCRSPFIPFTMKKTATTTTSTTSAMNNLPQSSIEMTTDVNNVSENHRISSGNSDRGIDR